jgi:hypothetical protein
MNWLVVGVVVCAVVLPLVMDSASSDTRHTVEAAGTVLAAAGCLLMLSWMGLADGARSKLWDFLPPFWPWGRFACTSVARWVLVLLVVAGTIMGIVSHRLK